MEASERGRKVRAYDSRSAMNLKIFAHCLNLPNPILDAERKRILVIIDALGRSESQNVQEVLYF